MKAIIAAGLGALALGGLLVANSGRSASAQPSFAAPAIVNQADASRTTLVNCGEGRQALIATDPRGTGLAQVQCVATETAGFAAGVPTAMPVSQFASSQFAPTVVSPVRPAVEERVEYGEPAARPVYRSASRTSTVRRSSAPVYRSSQPTYSRNSEVYAPQTRSWKKSAVIIGGSTAAGAGVGAILGGKRGAVKGGVVGLIGGTVYDVATRNKH
ncbi:MAG: hypothetical protein DMF78_22680 [Acidobacteria bacterium]|nr:MAG: hypothetical protein DMF78_22680 [Acidobacteriota bacterium]